LANHNLIFAGLKNCNINTICIYILDFYEIFFEPLEVLLKFVSFQNAFIFSHSPLFPQSFLVTVFEYIVRIFIHKSLPRTLGLEPHMDGQVG